MQDVESLITSASYAQANSPAQKAPLTELEGADLYANCARSPSGQLQLMTAPAGTLKKTLQMFTSPQHPGLAKPFAGLKWEAALNIITSGSDLDGIQVINLKNDWVAYSKAALRQI